MLVFPREAPADRLAGFRAGRAPCPKSREAGTPRSVTAAGAGWAATAPFVGLFGTVIGIINAFAQIATIQTAGLGTVASEIAGAFVTTALGLLVALPAVCLHNHLVQKVEQFEVEVDSFSSELLDRIADVATEGRAPRLGSR